MKIITGELSSKKMTKRIKDQGWGRMFIMMKPAPYEGEPWGFDNGAYRYFSKGEVLDETTFLKRFEVAHAVGKPYMAILPDIVEGGVASLKYSLEWLEKLPDWPWYLAVQDGITGYHVEPIIDLVDGIFLGGSTKYKSTAGVWSNFAHHHNKKFHYGRCGTIRKLQHAMDVGADSIDSAFPLWSVERFERFVHATQHLHEQIGLFTNGC